MSGNLSRQNVSFLHRALFSPIPFRGVTTTSHGDWQTPSRFAGKPGSGPLYPHERIILGLTQYLLSRCTAIARSTANTPPAPPRARGNSLGWRDVVSGALLVGSVVALGELRRRAHD